MANSHSNFEDIEPGLSNTVNNGEEEESNEGTEEVPDYLDKAGRRWHFLEHAKEEEDLARFCQQNGLVPGNENGKRRKFGCSRPECQFRAVFLKANSGIYTRGEHWHDLDGQITNVHKNDKTEASKGKQQIVHLSSSTKIVCGDDEEFLMNSFGRKWQLIQRFKSDEEFEKFRCQNWLMKRAQIESMLRFICRRQIFNSKLSTNCQVRAIYVESNRSLYQRNEHNHPIENYGQRSEGFYLDHHDKKWPLVQQFKTEEEFEKYRLEHCLKSTGRLKNGDMSRHYLVCNNGPSHSRPSTNCQVRAIYLTTSSSLYQLHEHNHPLEYHPMVNKNFFAQYLSRHSADDKVDFVGITGERWPFFCRIKNFKQLEKFSKEQMFNFHRANRKLGQRIYFECKYVYVGTLQRYPYPPPYCKKKAVFIKATSCLYVRNEHSNHPPIKMKPSSLRHGKLYNELNNFFGAKHGKKSKRNRTKNAHQNIPEPKGEAKDGIDLDEEEVRIVKHLQRDYKCLGRMKREQGEEGMARTRTIQLDEEEEDLEEGTSQGTRGRRGTFYRYTQRESRQPVIKKEEPEEAEPAAAAPLPVPQPQLPANIAWLQQFKVARPAKMLLRERKKQINYGK